MKWDIGERKMEELQTTSILEAHQLAGMKVGRQTTLRSAWNLMLEMKVQG